MIRIFLTLNQETVSHAINEVYSYLEDDVNPRNKDPLNWWRTNKNIHNFIKLLKKNFVCSSVPCERIFPKAGQVLNERRTRLSDNKEKLLLFFNLKLYIHTYIII